MSETINIPRPHVPFGPEQTPELLADADYLDHAADNLAGGYAVGGYNVTDTVIKLLHDTATSLRAEQREGSPLMPEPTEPPPYRIVKRIVDSMGGYDAQIAADVCVICGAVVVYVEGHAAWHRRIERGLIDA